MVYVESDRWIMLYRGGPPTPGTSVPVMPKIHRRLRAAGGGEGMVFSCMTLQKPTVRPPIRW